MEILPVLLLICAGLFTVDALQTDICKASAMHACLEELPAHTKYNKQIDDSDIRYTTEEILNDACSHVGGIDTCMRTNNCTGDVNVARWVNATTYMCGPGKAVYVKNLHCYFDKKTLDKIHDDCDPNGGVFRDNMNEEERCKSFKTFLLCGGRVYTDKCGKEASDTIMKANTLIAHKQVPRPEYCTLGCAALQLSLWVVLGALLFLRSI